MRTIMVAVSMMALGVTAAKADGPWSGFYAGAHIGYARGSADVTDTNGGVPPGPFSYSPSGAFGGATAGYNLQFQQFLIGVEGDFGYMNLKGSGTIPSSTPGQHQDLDLDGGVYGVAAARLGVVFGPALIYGKGGFGYFDGTSSQTTTKPGYSTSPTSSAFTGGVYGGGVEYMISRNISIKAEYLHFDFGKQDGAQTSISDPPIGFRYTNTTDLSADTVKFGVNVHF